jgi:hypothetical protein
MKNLTLLLMLLVFGIFACQQVKPPKEVSDAFAAKFTAAEKVQWEQEEENVWEADFMMEGKEITACFDNAGKWLETETVIGIEELPATFTDSLEVKFEGYEIEEAESIVKPDFTGFEIVLMKGDTEMEVIISPGGEIISQNMIEKEEGEDKEHESEEGDEDDD